MNRRAEAPRGDDAPASHESDDSTETVTFGYRGQQFEAEMGAEQQRAVEAVLERFVALGRIKD